jgi:hypothetical protein
MHALLDGEATADDIAAFKDFCLYRPNEFARVREISF